MKQKLLFLCVLLAGTGLSQLKAQTTLGFEDFDGNAINLNTTTNVFDYNAGGGTAGDVFGRVNGQLGGTGMSFDLADDTVEDVSGARTGAPFPTDELGIAGANTTAFFGMSDPDGAGVNNATWTFSGWGTATIGEISIDIAAMGDFETTSQDGFIIEASVDGGAYQEIFRAETNEAEFKTYRPLDGGFTFQDDDPLELFIDGSSTPFGFLDKCDPASGNFDTYTSTLLSGQNASSVDIRIRWQGNPSGSEPMGIDNITISDATSPILPLLISEIAVTPTAGEFVEIYNPNTTTVDLSDVYITDATFAGGGVYYYNIVTGADAGGGGFGDFLARFPTGATIGAGAYQTIAISGSDDFLTEYGQNPTYELYEDGGSADGIPDMLEGLPGSINNQGGFSNGGEVAILFYWDGQTDLVTDLDYVIWGDTAEAVDKSGVSIDGPDAGTDTSTYANDTPIANQQLVSDGSHAVGDSFQREDLTEGTEVATGGNGVDGNDETSEDLNNTWCISESTAGTENVCTTSTVPLSLISEVQGSGLTPAMDGMTVRVQAIVTGDFQEAEQLRGFFLQEEDTDADTDTMTSEGIFVYCNSCPTAVAVGDEVEVTGLAEDFNGMTQIDVTGGGIVNVISSSNTLPTPATISFPAPAGTDVEGTFEAIEGMLITVTNDLVVSEYFEVARYGQLVLSADERNEQFTDANEPDVAGYANFLTTLEQSRIILDDDNNTQNSAIATTPDTPYFWPRPGLSNTNLIRGGDQISNLTGIMHWDFSGQPGTDAWRIRPVVEEFTYDFTTNNPRVSTPEAVGGNFKVASFNVLNYFTTLDSRGANSTAELDRQREKIAAAICALDADVVGLIEIENNGNTAINDLLNGTNGINSICSSTYDFVETGIIGSDEITVAFIYNTATVDLEGAFAVLDSSVDPRFNDDKNRPALAQTFKQLSNNGLVTIVVNHLKSKGSPCDDVDDPNNNDGSGNCDGTRADAAAAMVDWLATDPTSSNDQDFLIIGDLNAYKNEAPIDNIKLGSDDADGTNDDYTDLIESFQGEGAYSFVFDGQLGYLDYALASSGLASQVTGTTVWHINADEINVFDYNDGIEDPGEAFFMRESNALPIYEPNAFRASDHDPILVGINLSVAPVINCPADVEIDNEPGVCEAVATFNDAIATDADGDLDKVVQTGGPASGSTFPVGTTEIEFTATDAAGNTSVCTFNVIVTDAEDPALTCPSDQTVMTGVGNTTYTVPDYFQSGDASATDNCTDPVTDVTQDPAAGTELTEGVYTVTLSATDDSDNTITCDFILTIEETLGMNENEFGNAISIFPNPMNETLTVSHVGNLGIAKISVHAIDGKVVLSEDFSSESSTPKTIDVSNLAAGIYLLEIVSVEETIAIKRVIKK